ncbi:cupin domain-containing protein [Paenibacillus sp. HN-1]|uniref:sugar phosphate nucleotidyltransferase n=1 Tax=Paenibacillus TaxID=44249 RepID=UPI001CA806D8|nr:MULTISPECIES: sugar phosphate nucleotidyltransferase [Paenibacillus]MBY9080114.1 cupin domain-containing protein [Paenibacillus sp. CGMCC 1.18879]MBY9086812.1 cupin domain-containing protein [Paenibacillus sinensis]
MQVVLLSGGSGKRLWPLSNEVRSKAFLRLLPAASGGLESMIERVCSGLAAAGLLSSCCVVTHRTQVEITRRSIGESIPVLAEPHKRGTFTAISLAAAYLRETRGIDPEEVVTILPVDSYVEPAFFSLIARFPQVLAESGADVALIGAAPRSPSTQFGYIVPRPRPEGVPEPEAGETEKYFEVARFAEKPDEAGAKTFIGEGALWNCGVFSCKLGYLLSQAQAGGLHTDYRELLDCYGQLSERSFDVEVIERSQRAVVIPYEGLWEDIGSWDALTPHLGKQVTGAGTLSPDSEGSFLINELSCPIHVIGVKDTVVAAGPDGILVAGKDRAKEIKNALTGEPKKPMVEERRWGISRVLDWSRIGEQGETIVSKVTLLPGGHSSYHLHRHTREMWTVLSGSGEYRLESGPRPMRAGDVIAVPPGAGHALKAGAEALELIVTEIREAGAPAEDIVRITYDWTAPAD